METVQGFRETPRMCFLTLGCEEVGLHGDDAVIRRAQRIDSQKLLLQSAINDNIIIGITQRFQHLRQHLFRAAFGFVHGSVLRDLHDLEPRRRIR